MYQSVVICFVSVENGVLRVFCSESCLVSFVSFVSVVL